MVSDWYRGVGKPWTFGNCFRPFHVGLERVLRFFFDGMLQLNQGTCHCLRGV